MTFSQIKGHIKGGKARIKEILEENDYVKLTINGSYMGINATNNCDIIKNKKGAEVSLRVFTIMRTVELCQHFNGVDDVYLVVLDETKNPYCFLYQTGTKD
jgi:hypothetical protein